MLAAAVALIWSAQPGPVAPLLLDSTQKPDAARTLKLTPSEMFGLAEQADSNGNEALATRLYDALQQDHDREVRIEARFRQALRLEKRDRLRDAAVLLRQILDEKPDAAPVRLRLAELLNKLGDQDAALRELRALQAKKLPPTVTHFVDQLAATLQATKPFGFQFEIAAAPDSNLNHATDSDTLGTVFGDFAVAPEARAKSGIGVAIRTVAQSRVGISPSVTLISWLSTDSSLYRDKQFNDVNMEIATGPELLIGRARIGINFAAAQQWYGMKSYQRTYRVANYTTFPVTRTSQTRIDAGIRRTINRANGLQDGYGVDGRVSYEKALSAQLAVGANGGFDRYIAADKAFSTRSWTLGASVRRDVGRISLSGGLQVGRLKADDRLFLLPRAREDRSARLWVEAVFRQLTVAGLAPICRLVVERNQSSVELYDFKRRRTEIGISRAF